MVKIWEQYLKQNTNPDKLQVILPIVIYQGKQKWGFKSSISHLFENIENTEDYIPEFKSEVFDVSHIPDEKVKGEILLRVSFLIQKYSGTPQIFEKLHEILLLILSLSDNRTKTEYLETLLRYLVATTDSEHMYDLKTELEKSIEHGGKSMPTIAEKWFQDGKIKGKIEDALKMIELKMSNDDIHKITGLDTVRIEELRNGKSNSKAES